MQDVGGPLSILLPRGGSLRDGVAVPSLSASMQPRDSARPGISFPPSACLAVWDIPEGVQVQGGKPYEKRCGLGRKEL